jgi:hypothetical protein
VRAHVRTRHALQPATDLAGRPRLLAAAPIVAVSEELNRHVGELTRLAPASDATTALTLYRDRLANALAQARNIELFVPVDVAANMLGKSPSGITYLCRAGALKAKKVGGVWQIDRVDLERVRSTEDNPLGPSPSAGEQ